MTDYIERARKMLTEFMDATGATAPEMDKVLSFSPGRVDCILTADGALANMWADGVCHTKGTPDEWRRKLDVLRDPSKATIPAPAKKPEKPAESTQPQEEPTMKKEKDFVTVDQKTALKKRIADHRKQHGVTNDELAEAMSGTDAAAGHTFKASVMSTYLSPSGRLAVDLYNKMVAALDALEKPEEEQAEDQASPGCESPDPSAAGDTQGNPDESSQGPTDPANIAAHRAADEFEDTQHDGLDAEEPPLRGVATFTEPCVVYPIGNNELSVKPLAEAIHDLSRDYFIDMLGLDIEEIKALAPMIEHAVVARRNGTPCRLVTGDIEVG